MRKHAGRDRAEGGGREGREGGERGGDPTGRQAGRQAGRRGGRFKNSQPHVQNERVCFDLLAAPRASLTVEERLVVCSRLHLLEQRPRRSDLLALLAVEAQQRQRGAAEAGGARQDDAWVGADA